MSPGPVELRELGQFLRTRREELQPDHVGLVPRIGDGRRRVSGLRREEVAQLVSISTDYYIRIEQGRLAPSDSILPALERALRLSDEQRDYVRTLLRTVNTVDTTAASRRRRSHPVAVRPQLRRLLARLDDVPAMVLGSELDILAWNDLASALLIDFSTVPRRDRNYARLVFTDDTMRGRYPDWEQVARTCVAVLRMNAAEDPTNPELSRLVGDLSIGSAEFRQWWAERRVAHLNFGVKRIRHPQVGEMSLNWDGFQQATHLDQQLVMWSADPDTDSAARLDALHRM
ncbi:transcriptional regulator with XRE-family HTH domain [Curtobacterium pusillum]|uniref:Transcriptional regulator with XRE-family HTH domain n=1 Tax=Curtobacterium pusillum TaxID=69373 RepID=A0AAW3TA60_9MICO|nr:helix-turn-helix domain-containing protein [Curtobacterium pusillum]MBA8992023.1 transcriptional regulator with XRE-family HTH domain [Curtobacterium pusillum]